MLFQKKIRKKLKFFFDPENMKKKPTKVAHNWAQTIFLYTGSAAQMTQK